MEQEQNNSKEIRLKDLWNVFLRCWWIMAIAAVIAVVGFGIYVKLTYIPYYKSTATLYIIKNDGEDRATTNSDFTLAMNVVKDCDYLLKSHLVLDEVIDELHLDISYTNLKNSISTKNPDGTRFLEVSVKNLSSKEAKKIVDKVCEVGIEKSAHVMGIKQLNHCQEGTLNYVPFNNTSRSRYLLVGAVFAVLVFIIYLLIYLFDNSISTDEEIENVLHLTVLGDIPDANSSRRGGHRNKEYGNVGRSSSNKKTSTSIDENKEGLSE